MKRAHCEDRLPAGRPPKAPEDRLREARFTVSIPPKLVGALREESSELGLPVSAFMRMAVIKELRRIEAEREQSA